MKETVLQNGIVIHDTIIRNCDNEQKVFYVGRFSDGTLSIPLPLELLKGMIDNRSPKVFKQTFKQYKTLGPGFVFPNGMTLVEQSGKDARGENLFIAVSPYNQLTKPQNRRHIASMIVGDFVTRIGYHITPNVFVTDYELLTTVNRFQYCKYHVSTTSGKKIGAYFDHQFENLRIFEEAEHMLGFVNIRSERIVDYSFVKRKKFLYTLQKPNGEVYEVDSMYKVYHPNTGKKRYNYLDCVGMVLDNGVKILECVKNSNYQGYLLVGMLPDGTILKPQSIQSLKAMRRPIIPVSTHEGELLPNGVELLQYVPDGKFIARYKDGTITPEPLPYYRLVYCCGRPVEWAKNKIGKILPNGYQILSFEGRSKHGVALFKAQKEERTYIGTYQQICKLKDIGETINTIRGVSMISQDYFDSLAKSMPNLVFQYWKTAGEKIFYYDSDSYRSRFYRLDCYVNDDGRLYDIEYDGIGHPLYEGDLNYYRKTCTPVTLEESKADWQYDRKRDGDMIVGGYSAVIRIHHTTSKEHAVTACKDIINNQKKGVFFVRKDEITNYPFYNTDMVVLDWIEGTNRFEGMLGAIVCQSSDGKVVTKVGTGFTEHQRATIKREDIVGKIVTVMYNTRIKDKNRPDVDSLFLPRFIEIREDKDQADCSENIH